MRVTGSDPATGFFVFNVDESAKAVAFWLAPQKTLVRMTMRTISKTGRVGKPIVVAISAVIFILWATPFARSGVPLAAVLPLDDAYQYVRLGPCRHSPAAIDRHRLWPCSRSGVRKPIGIAITQFGPGSLRLQGTPDSLRLEARDSTIAAVLAVMGRAFNTQYRSSTALDDPITGTYVGSLTRVIARVLDGYDYALTHEGLTVEIAVFGRSRGRAEPVQPTPATVVPARRSRCGRSAGHQAACAPL